MNQAQMLEEERLLEQKLFGTPAEAETTEAVAPVVPTEKEVVPAKDETVIESESKPTEEPVVQEREEDWKLRFTNLRASRDKKLYDAQAALATAEATISILQQKMKELMEKTPDDVEDIFKDAFTEEEREALGDTAINAMQKTAKLAADAKTKKIQKELDESRAKAVEEAKRQASRSSEAAYGTFIERLASIVPEYAEIDRDPAFKVYCNGPDIDGSPIADSFLAAEKRGDVGTIARFMKDFLLTKNPKAAAKAALDSKVNPTGSKGSSGIKLKETKSVLSMKDIDAHYRKYATGGYKGKNSEYLEMEKRIDAAALSGNIMR